MSNTESIELLEAIAISVRDHFSDMVGVDELHLSSIGGQPFVDFVLDAQTLSFMVGFCFRPSGLRVEVHSVDERLDNCGGITNSHFRTVRPYFNHYIELIFMGAINIDLADPESLDKIISFISDTTQVFAHELP